MIATHLLAPPPLTGLATALEQAGHCFARVDAARAGRHVNREGGDVSLHGQQGLMLRHVVNYLAAVELGQRLGTPAPLVDVGSGVGALGAWAALRLDVVLHLVDHDPHVRAVAAQAFPQARVHERIEDAPAAGLLTAMEVLEHLPHAQQPAFVHTLADGVAPGGLLVLSTPDESGYPGGWSGYAPHVGPVDYGQLAGLLTATGLPAAVWRIAGPGFRLGRMQRLVQPLANRAWSRATRRWPQTTDRLVHVAARAADRLPGRAVPTLPAGAITVRDDATGTGTGLVGVLHRPGRVS